MDMSDGKDSDERDKTYSKKKSTEKNWLDGNYAMQLLMYETICNILMKGYSNEFF